MPNQPLPVSIIMFVCFLTIIGMTVYDISIDIRNYRAKRYLSKRIHSKCPNCGTHLKIQKVDKKGQGDIDYFVYCDKCRAMYKVKYRE